MSWAGFHHLGPLPVTFCSDCSVKFSGHLTPQTPPVEHAGRAPAAHSELLSPAFQNSPFSRSPAQHSSLLHITCHYWRLHVASCVLDYLQDQPVWILLQDTWAPPCTGLPRPEPSLHISTSLPFLRLCPAWNMPSDLLALSHSYSRFKFRIPLFPGSPP